MQLLICFSLQRLTRPPTRRRFVFFGAYEKAVDMLWNRGLGFEGRIPVLIRCAGQRAHAMQDDYAGFDCVSAPWARSSQLQCMRSSW